MSKKKVVLGITGCIGAYKAAEIVRGLKKEGYAVQVIMTTSSQEFITPLTLETLSEAPVITHLFGPRRGERTLAGEQHEIGHAIAVDREGLAYAFPVARPPVTVGRCG